MLIVLDSELGQIVTNWKGKGMSHPPSRMPAVALLPPLATLQVCETLVPSTGISPSVDPGCLQPHTLAAATAVGSCPWLMSPLSPAAMLWLMSPLLLDILQLDGLVAGEAAAPGADKRFHSPPGSVGAESPRWLGSRGLNCQDLSESSSPENRP